MVKISKQMHVASIRNSRYKIWMLKTIYRTHKESARVTFVEALKLHMTFDLGNTLPQGLNSKETT